MSTTIERGRAMENNTDVTVFSSMAHVLVLPTPTQGHINPMLQFAKRLASKGLKVTLVTTHYIIKSIPAIPGPVGVEPISDGYDEGGMAAADSLDVYLKSLKDVGSTTLAELIEKRKSSDRPFTCVVFDTYEPWAMDVARRSGLLGVRFSTQCAATSAIYYYVNKGVLEAPSADGIATGPMFGLPALMKSEFPSMAVVDGPYRTLAELSRRQFENLEAADWVLFNTFEELEREVIAGLKLQWQAKPIGPTVPSMLVDKNVEGDPAYGVNLLQPEDDACMKWLSGKEDHSVVYVSFGSFATLGLESMEEMALALRHSNYHFLWVVRSSELGKLPENFAEETAEKGLVVTWCPQLAVLGHRATGCFVTHCGWNSIMEALSLGVPTVALPQWTDQPPNAKFVEDVWGVGVRARVDGEKKIVDREEVGRCIKEVMEGERGGEIRGNAMKWRELAMEALSEGGSSDKNLNEFVEFVNANVKNTII